MQAGGERVTEREALRTLGLTPREFADARRRSQQRDGSTAGDADRQSLASTCERVLEHYGGNAAPAELWFRVPNPMLNGLEPRDLIRYGRLRELQDRVARER